MNSYIPRRSTRGHHYRQNPLTVRYHKRPLLVHTIWQNRHNYANINIVVWLGRQSWNCFGIFTYIYIYVYIYIYIYMNDAYWFITFYLFIFLFFMCHKECQLCQLLGFPLRLTGGLESVHYFWGNMMTTGSTCICVLNLGPSPEWPHGWYFELLL